jgi:hypothetical protein
VKKFLPLLTVVHGSTLLQSLACAALFVPLIWIIQRNISSPVIIVLLSLGICVPAYFTCQTFIMKNKMLRALLHFRT